VADGAARIAGLVEPDLLVERLMAEIDRIANTPCPLAEREQRIAKLEEEIGGLRRLPAIRPAPSTKRYCRNALVTGLKIAILFARSMCLSRRSIWPIWGLTVCSRWRRAGPPIIPRRYSSSTFTAINRVQSSRRLEP
jgi:hypothetical protein